MRSSKFLNVVVFLLILLLVPVTSFTQNAVKKTKFNRGLIIKKDGSRFSANNLVFSDQSLSFNDARTQKPGQLSLSEVEYVRARYSSHALEGALIGGGLFFLIGVAAVLDAESDPNVEVTNAEEAILIVTGIGFGGGLLIGAAYPKEKPVFQYNKLVAQKLAPQDFDLTGSNKKVTFLSLHFAF